VLFISLRLASVMLPAALVACGGPPSTSDLPRVVALSRPTTLAIDVTPPTLEQALDELDRGLSGRDFSAIQILSEDDAVASHYRWHLGWGAARWQHPWNLFREGPLQRELAGAGFRHADDMSEAILRSFWRRLHGRPFDLSDQVKDANRVREAVETGLHWVVFPEESAHLLLHRCGRKVPSSDGTWRPDTATIAHVERLLQPALQDALNRKMSAGGPPLKASDYYRQYGGIITEGRKVVYVNGFHGKLLIQLMAFPRDAMFWHMTPVLVCDAGPSLFGAEYDLSTRRLRSIAFDSSLGPSNE